MDQTVQIPNEELQTPGQNRDTSKGFNNEIKINLVKHNRMLSIIGQIFNYQQTGWMIKLNLPLVNVDNVPICAIRVSPIWPSLNMILSQLTSMPTSTIAQYNQRVASFFHNMSSLHVPMDKRDLLFDDRSNIGSGITLMNTDDAPLISLLAFHHMGWTGSLQFLFKVITNVTTQGKISMSRSYHQPRIQCFADWFSKRTPFNCLPSSQRWRRDNSFMLFDLSRQEDIEINCPFVHEYPWHSTLLSVTSSIYDTTPQEIIHDSYIFMDIIGALAQSAAATECIIEIQIKAGPDFQLMGALPLGGKTGFIAGESFISDGRPVVMGSGAQFRWLSETEVGAIS